MMRSHKVMLVLAIAATLWYHYNKRKNQEDQA
mgnify:FL=1